jgi:glycosyltransferase involved in cell wall biosynthesis
MRAVPGLLSADSDLQVLIIGSDANGYGLPPVSGLSWRQTLEAETLSELSEQSRSRVHFLGKLPYREYLSVLSVSTVHIYLTYPFVLSWSLMEAMSMGCAIVASDTTPVSEVITHDEQGLLTDFFSPAALAAAVQQLLSDEALRTRLGSNARKKIVEEYDLKTRSLPRLMAWACNTD